MIVGSQPRNALDVDHLAAEGITCILNLQQVPTSCGDCLHVRWLGFYRFCCPPPSQELPA